MKSIIKKISFAAVGSLMLIPLSGCTNDFEEINTDPNKIVVGQMTPYNMFESLLYGGANTRGYHTWYYAGEIVQYTASISSNIRIGTYDDLNNKFYDNVWSAFCNYGSNAVHMYQLAEKDGDEACKAIALILKVMNMEEVTAMFGDIPYSEAFKAHDNLVCPKFDTQREVYEQMFAELEQANEILAKSPKFERPQLDGMYAGDMTKWRKLCNSLYLRLLCRVSNRNSEMDGAVAKKLQEIVDKPSLYPIFASNADNATVTYSGIAPYTTTFTEAAYTFSTYSDTRHMSEEMVKQLVQIDEDTEAQELEDPRARVYYYKSRNKNNTDEKWFGAIAGASPAQMDQNPSYQGLLNAPVFCDPAAPYTYMMYGEVQLILAEMTYKGLISGGDTAAKKYYESALRAGCEHWSARLEAATRWNTSYIKPASISTVEINTFINSDLAGWENNSNKLKLLGNQKYIMLFQNSYQAFYEIQRTGYPELKIGLGTSCNNYTFPTRMAYPINTIGTNPTNAAEAIARQGWKENNMREFMWYSWQASNTPKK